ncbi:MAG: hypothetical protein LBR50_00375 [Tannerella sp.]|jgi:hypothetical protein|nr:hypothetical protein [Tannerella sp.]
MKHLTKLCLSFIVVGLVCSTASAAQKVPIKFDKYHGYTGTVEYLKAVNKAYPDITELTEIGKSSQQRPIYVLVITNRKTGATLDREKKLVYERKLEVPNPPIMPLHTGKPGHLLTGATHGNEQTGTEVVLYFIDKILSGYGSDKEITDLVDTKVFYVIPANNPDGLHNTVDLGAPQRQNSMYQDTAAAPQRKDLNGDGLFAQIRYKDPKGRYVKDAKDPRIMNMYREGVDDPKAERYSVESEAQPDKGIDINRNFPYAWWNEQTTLPGGTGEYPTQAPEVHALCEFVINHPNIIMVNEYHTMGGHVYRPMGATGDADMEARDVAVYDFIMGKKYVELMGTEMPAAWANPRNIQQFKDSLRGNRNLNAAKRGYKLPYEWRVPYMEDDNRSTYHGLFLDWLYKHNGAYSLVTELWNPAHDVPELKGVKDDDLQPAILKYLDDKGYKLYLDWKPAKHPKYGDVEVGGWVGQVGRNNAYPGAILENICERQWQFDLFRSTLMPQLAINDITVKKQSSGGTTVLEISVEVENTGKLPTGLANTENIPLNRGDVVWLIGENNKVTFLSGNPYEKLGQLNGTMPIPGFEQRGAGGPGGGFGPAANAGPSNKKTVKWIVALEGSEKLKIVASSLKGGTVVKEVKY